jgi:hypothetical protein
MYGVSKASLDLVISTTLVRPRKQVLLTLLTLFLYQPYNRILSLGVRSRGPILATTVWYGTAQEGRKGLG